MPNFDILENLPVSKEKPSTLVVSNSDKHLTIAIRLMNGQVLKKHMSATPAMIIVLKGEVLFEMEGNTSVIKELNTFEIPATVPHEVTGLEESVFLLIKDKV
jgi:quercetin dioxygenase-like cupin family protein